MPKHAKKTRKGEVGRGRKRERRQNFLRSGDPEFRAFSEQLSGQGLVLVDVPGDGNCLFRALADQLNGDCDHRQIRAVVVQFMREHGDDFSPFVEEDVTFEQHLADLAEDGEYAGNDAIVAFARCYRVGVAIHQLGAPRWEVNSPGAGGMMLQIAYLRGEHYCSVKREAGLQPSGTQRWDPRPSGVQQRGSQGGAAMQQLLDNSGCKDPALAEQCLRENEGNADLALVELLQLMALDAAPSLPMVPEVPPPKELPPTPKSKGGGPLKKPLPQPQRHLSNRERKEQAKSARKARRVETQRSHQPPSTSEPTGAMAI